MSRSRSGTQAGFSSATVITTSPSTSSSRSSSPTAVSHDVKQVGVDVLAALLVTLLGRAPRLVQVHVPLGGAFDDSRNAARAAQVVFQVEPARGVEAHGQQLVQRAPVED